mmetsp:Transcript_9906/g.22772  ORF Transcript_9906/g.22772 Transcript_9906/m.22772 type:complete len:241 (+) Transcript_9906:3667-4389(+)
MRFVVQLAGRNNLLRRRLTGPTKLGKSSSRNLLVLHLERVEHVGLEGDGGSGLVTEAIPAIDEWHIVHPKPGAVVCRCIERVDFRILGLQLANPAHTDVIGASSGQRTGAPVQVDLRIDRDLDGCVKEPHVLEVRGRQTTACRQLHSCLIASRLGCCVRDLVLAVQLIKNRTTNGTSAFKLNNEVVATRGPRSARLVAGRDSKCCCLTRRGELETVCDCDCAFCSICGFSRIGHLDKERE